MTYLNGIENIILQFKRDRDYVVSSENDGRTKKLIYSVISNELKQKVSPFPQFISENMERLKTEEGNRNDGYFSYEVGRDSEPDKFTMITGLEAEEREVKAFHRPREISQRMREIEQRQRQIAQQMQEVRDSRGSEIINVSSYTEHSRKGGDEIAEICRIKEITDD
ncbi:MAG: hypothetical protein MRERC_5c078 [Mycoplasmataceae bacterium RC_NB112A]|nr:MAG: hypothetical protein MRERC_5c078 [Mycoplasmataceae bacterium RC_NB112A]